MAAPVFRGFSGRWTPRGFGRLLRRAADMPLDGAGARHAQYVASRSRRPGGVDALLPPGIRGASRLWHDQGSRTSKGSVAMDIVVAAGVLLGLPLVIFIMVMWKQEERDRERRRNLPAQHDDPPRPHSHWGGMGRPGR